MLFPFDYNNVRVHGAQAKVVALDTLYMKYTKRDMFHENVIAMGMQQAHWERQVIEQSSNNTDQLLRTGMRHHVTAVC